MTNTQLSIYNRVTPLRSNKTYKDIREAFEEVTLGSDIHVSIANLYSNGSTPANYHHYLKRLDAVKLVREQGGYKGQEAEMIVKSGFYDPWTMLQSTCLYILDKPLPKEFQTLVLDPADKRIELIRDQEKQRTEALQEAQKTISSIIKPLKKASEELGSFEPWKMAGSYPESLRIEINKVLFKLGVIDEHGVEKKKRA